MRRLYFNRIKYLSYDGGVFWSNFHSMKQTEGSFLWRGRHRRSGTRQGLMPPPSSSSSCPIASPSRNASILKFVFFFGGTTVLTCKYNSSRLLAASRACKKKTHGTAKTYVYKCACGEDRLLHGITEWVRWGEQDRERERKRRGRGRHPPTKETKTKENKRRPPTTRDRDGRPGQRPGQLSAISVINVVWYQSTNCLNPSSSGVDGA